jgi:hypothetical protein
MFSSDMQLTCLFIPDDQESDTITKAGKGYIGAQVNYRHYSELSDEFMFSYILCDAIEVDDYDK